MNKKCVNCGKKFEKGAQICPFCGAMQEDAGVLRGGDVIEIDPTEKDAKRQKAARDISVPAVVVGAIAILLAIWELVFLNA